VSTGGRCSLFLLFQTSTLSLPLPTEISINAGATNPSIIKMVWSDYTWIFVCSIILALFVAWGIGANDVANSFATSVGSKALSLRQAVIVAAIFEFGGAMLLGSGVTSTIRKGIAKVDSYTYSPELLMYMMLCAMLSAGLWLALATFLELPVSTTHSMVGAIVGASMVAAGADSVEWYKAPKGGDNPFPGGVVSIILAWIITPMIAALVAALLFVFTKVVVLNARNPFKMSLILFPLFTFITAWVITYFVIQKGVNGWMKNETYTGTVESPPSCPPGGSSSKYVVSDDQTTGEGESCTLKPESDIEVTLAGCKIPNGTAAWISAVTAAVCALVVTIGLKLVIKLVDRDMAEYERMVAEVENAKNGDEESGGHGKVEAQDSFVAGQKRGRTPAALADMRKSRVWKALANGTNQDIHAVTETNEKIKQIHEGAQVFDVKTEFSFKYLQVITACANSFAHGANDVANSIGSFAAIYGVWQCTCAESKVQVPIWMFVIGGIGIVLGLATYGYKIMRALGVKLVKITNSRGYCAELTSSITVIVASRYGFPVSTTQVITGAITGIGLVEVIGAKMRKESRPGSLYNWTLLLKFFLGWVATVVVAGLVAAAFTAQGIYAPYKNGVDTRAQFNAAFNEVNEGIATTLIEAGNVTNPTPAEAQAGEWGLIIQQLNEEIATSDDAMLLDPNAYLYVYQNGSYYLGNSTLNGAFGTDEKFAPIMPLESTVSSSGFPVAYPADDECDLSLSDETLESKGLA
jgi:sodium-dependent phosphate transporter